MMRDAVINVGVPGRSGGLGGRLALVLTLGALAGLLLAVATALGSIQQTVMLSDPNVRAAEARAKIADADLRAAQSEHDRASIQHAQAIEASWDPITAGVLHGVGLGLLVAVPAFLLLGAGLLFRRHLSLPTKDGRVAIVGLDRELSREALIRYQLRELAGVATYEALPLQAEQPAMRAGQLVGGPLQEEEAGD
jgi:hypothetical protein